MFKCNPCCIYPWCQNSSGQSPLSTKRSAIEILYITRSKWGSIGKTLYAVFFTPPRPKMGAMVSVFECSLLWAHNHKWRSSAISCLSLRGLVSGNLCTLWESNQLYVLHSTKVKMNGQQLALGDLVNLDKMPHCMLSMEFLRRYKNGRVNHKSTMCKVTTTNPSFIFHSLSIMRKKNNNFK